jgi:hypothetical protein
MPFNYCERDCQRVFWSELNQLFQTYLPCSFTKPESCQSSVRRRSSYQSFHQILDACIIAVISPCLAQLLLYLQNLQQVCSFPYLGKAEFACKAFVNKPGAYGVRQDGSRSPLLQLLPEITISDFEVPRMHAVSGEKNFFDT